MGKKWLTGFNQDLDCEIVDQSSRADYRSSDQAHAALWLIERFERRRINQREIVDPQESGVDERLLGLLEGDADIGPAADQLTGGRQRSWQGNRPFALVGTKIGIARRESETVRFADGRHSDYLHRNVEVGDHSPDHTQLLKVLFAEQRQIGTHREQKLGDDGCNSI